MQAGHPIAFAGRQLNAAEKNYTTQDMELLAVMYAIKQWRCYLYGAAQKFVLITDHHPNTYFSTKPLLSSRQARWSQHLQDYDFTWEFRAGSNNIADPLSRRPYLLTAMRADMHGMHWDWCQRSEDLMSGLSSAIVLHPEFMQHLAANAAKREVPFSCVSAAVLTRAQRGGGNPPAPSVQQGRSRKRKAHDPMGLLADNEGAAEALKPMPPVEDPAVYGSHDAVHFSMIPELREAYRKNRRPKVYAQNGLWYRNGVICIPDSPVMKRRILTELHDNPVAGHGEELKTIQLLRRFFWWLDLGKDCRQYVKGCDQCQRNKASTRKHPGLLMPNPVATQKWQQFSMDFITHLPKTLQGHDSIMVVVCTLTKMCHFIPCTESMSGEGTAVLYMREVWKLHGWPEVFITDRDTRFTSPFFRALCTQLGIRQGMSSARHPETDGQTERMNRI